MVGQVEAVVVRMQEVVPDTMSHDVSCEREHAARPEPEVVAHLAEHGDDVEHGCASREPDHREDFDKPQACDLGQQPSAQGPPGDDVEPTNQRHRARAEVARERSPPRLRRKDVPRVVLHPADDASTRRKQIVGIALSIAKLEMVLEVRVAVTGQVCEHQGCHKDIRDRVVDGTGPMQVSMPRVVKDVAQSPLAIGNHYDCQWREPPTHVKHRRYRDRDRRPVHHDVPHRAPDVQFQQRPIWSSLLLQLRAKNSQVLEDGVARHCCCSTQFWSAEGSSPAPPSRGV